MYQIGAAAFVLVHLEFLICEEPFRITFLFLACLNDFNVKVWIETGPNLRERWQEIGRDACVCDHTAK